MDGDARIDRDEAENVVPVDGIAAAGQLVIDVVDALVDDEGVVRAAGFGAGCCPGLAALDLGRRCAALLFGLFRALSNVYMGFGFLTAMNIPSPVYNMMPYIISLIVLAFTSKRSRAPKAEGIPYDKGQR